MEPSDILPDRRRPVPVAELGPGLRGCQEMPFVGAYFFVIPEWSAGPGPEPMNTGYSRVGGGGLCSWIPGSRAAPEPRNDEYFRFSDSRLPGRRGGCAEH